MSNIKVFKKSRYYYYLFVGFIFLQSCNCYQFAGGIGAIKDGYFSSRKSDRTIDYIRILDKIGEDHPNLKIDSLQVNNYFKESYFSLSEKKQIFDSGKPYPLHPLISCPFKDGVNCKSIWYLMSPNNDLIFEIGLFYQGFSLTHIHSVNDKFKTKSIGVYELCDMPRKERNILRKEYVKRFEEEILPIMQPYFNAPAPASSK
jgi:uncharacterized protein YnzC (UPF0291/DUF896 family)